MGRATREEWAARVAQLKESGLSLARFAAESGLNAKTLAWWRAEIARSPGDAAQRSLAKRQQLAARRAAPINFIEMPSDVDAEAIEIVFPSRVVVRVRSGFDASTLERVVDVLQSRRR